MEVDARLRANFDQAEIQAAEGDNRREETRASHLDARSGHYLEPQMTRIGARAKSSVQSLPSLRRWSGKWIVSTSVVMAVLQVFIVARSMGVVSPSGLGIARGGSVMIGIMFMIMGNIAPKMPVPPRRSSFEIDSWDASRMLRFGGKLLVGLGLAFVLGGILLPPEVWAQVFGSLMLAALAAGIWYGIKLRRERSMHGARSITTSDN